MRVTKAGAGCYIGNVGALAYTDDVVLSAPSDSALRNMLAIVLLLNTKKSKCLTMCFRGLSVSFIIVSV